MSDEQPDGPPLDVDLRHGDCLAVLRTLPANSVHAVITDPPYGLANTTPAQVVDAVTRWARGERDYVPTGKGFMGRSWDAFVPPPAVWDECYRVLKPGGHLLAFSSTRTLDLLTLAVRFAGFDVRDGIAWLYGSGFPKSLNVATEVDKLDAADERRQRALEFTAWMRSTGITTRAINTATNSNMGGHYLTDREQPTVAVAAMFDRLRPLLPAVPERIESLVHARTVESANYAAREVTGEHTKPAAAALWRHAYTGDPAKLDAGAERRDRAHTEDAQRWEGWGTALKPANEPIVVARKPLAGTVAANVLAHGTGAINVDGCRVGTDPIAAHGGGVNGSGRTYGMGAGIPAIPAGSNPHVGRWPTNVVLDDAAAAALDEQTGRVGMHGQRKGGGVRTNSVFGTCDVPRRDSLPADEGGASRFYPVFRYAAKAPASERPVVGGVAHETVKPLELMRWLVRLFAAPGSTVLDPFAGSGTTIEAAVLERCRAIGVELTPEYLPLIRARVQRVTIPGLHTVELPDPPAVVRPIPGTAAARRAAPSHEQLDIFGAPL